MGKKELLANVLFRCGLFNLIRSIRTERQGDLLVLAYHRILDVDNYKTYPFDIELISASCDEFKWQMEHLKKYYNPITLLNVIDLLSENKPIPARSVVVTFDDGFNDNYYNAFRILKNLELPATFFVSTDYLDQKETFWFDWLVFAIKQTNSSIIELPKYEFSMAIPKNVSDRTGIINKTMRLLRGLPDEDRLTCIVLLKEQLDVVISEEDLLLSGALTSKQVQEMALSGMEIGSHTKSHPMLSRLTIERLNDEMCGSREVLNNIEGVRCDTIAFPFGGASAFNEQVKTAANNAGYKIACSYQSGVSNVLADDVFQLKRLHVDYDLSRASFVAMLADPALFALHWTDGSVYSA